MKDIYVKFGEVLKLERENRRLSIETVSDELKIAEEYIEHVEAGASDQTPSELYYTLFAKSYAQYLGIDYVRTMEAIKEDLGEPIENSSTDRSEKVSTTSDEEIENEQASVLRETQSKGFDKRLLGWAALILIIFAGFIVVWLVLFDDSGVIEDRPADTSQIESEEIVTDTSATPNQLAEYEWGTVSNAPASPLKLIMIASDSCWARVIADGKEVIGRNLIVWREYVVEAKYRLQVTIAHPAVVQTTLNGDQVDLRDPQTRRIRNREITQINWREYFAPPDTVSLSPTMTVSGEDNAPKDTTYLPSESTELPITDTTATPNNSEDMAVDTGGVS